MFASEGLIKEVVILLQLVLFHHKFAFGFLLPLWLDVSEFNSPRFWFVVGLWLIMVNGRMIGLWFVIGVNWLVIRMDWLMVGMNWLWLMIRVNRLWFMITTWLLPMSSVNWITFLFDLWVVETVSVLVDAWNWVWVPELWVSKMITDRFLISIGWRVIGDRHKDWG